VCVCVCVHAHAHAHAHAHTHRQCPGVAAVEAVEGFGYRGHMNVHMETCMCMYACIDIYSIAGAEMRCETKKEPGPAEERCDSGVRGSSEVRTLASSERIAAARCEMPAVRLDCWGWFVWYVCMHACLHVCMYVCIYIYKDCSG